MTRRPFIVRPHPHRLRIDTPVERVSAHVIERTQNSSEPIVVACTHTGELLVKQLYHPLAQRAFEHPDSVIGTYRRGARPEVIEGDLLAHRKQLTTRNAR